MHPSDFGSNRSRVPALDRNSAVDANRLSTWYEDLEEYEGNLEEMASANLDQSFQDEMAHVNQWFGYLSDPEKTATLYTLLQHSSQVQIRFFIHLLQEMRKPKPNPINQSSERASSLMNLNRRQQQQQQQQQQAPPPPRRQPTNRNINNRHSFALGDTEELSRMFGTTLTTDWLNANNIEERQPPPPPRNLSASSSHLRPKSVMELSGSTFDSTFSNSWLNQRQPTLFNDNVIERPRSADISSWALPTTVTNTSAPSWKPLGSQHDIDFQHHWKETPIQRLSSNVSADVIEESRTHSPSGLGNNNNNRNSGFGQFLSPPQNFSHGKSRSSSADLSDGILGYGSDQSDSRYNNRNSISLMGKQSHSSTPTTINENKEEAINMELLKDVTAWFRSLRLHKYNSIFEHMCWQDIIKLDDNALQGKGVAALGARRKMLKVFENIRDHCEANNIEY